MSSSLQVVIRKAVRKVRRELKFLFQSQRDAWHSTYVNSSSSSSGQLHSYFRPVEIDWWRSPADHLATVTSHYLDHRFDLLGSGWVQVRHGMYCRGLESYVCKMGIPVHADSEGRWLEGRINQANLAESQRIWRLVDRCYIPIDWHLDFKSGYRWSEDIWYKDIPYGHKLGVDVKVPWELARMQHLPQLAWAYALATERQKGFGPPQVYAREFRSQVLDFIATNPPRFGVNWNCTMDVGIRVANWLVAYDLLRAYGAEFDTEFEKEFSHSVYQHGLHIINNLEWFPEHRANHYLADIAGLLFVAAYLPRTPTTDAWLAFAVQELIAEVDYQFYPDGANFEASTSYHRLSAEMVVYATALVLGLPPEKQLALKEYDHHLHKARPKLKPAPLPLYPLAGDGDRLTPFPPWYIERLEKMAEFTMHITKPNGHIPQIGDNDSGRFLKLQSVYRQMTVAEAKSCYANLDGYTDLPDNSVYWHEDFLDHRHLVAAINGLFRRDDFAAFTGEGWLETKLVGNLARGDHLPSYQNQGQATAAERVRIGREEDWERLKAELDLLPEKHRQVIEIPAPGGDLLEGLRIYAYPDFGLYLYRSKRLYLAVRCGAIGQNGNGGHAHNDQLAIELNVDGKDWIADPGTYLYTPLPTRRNEYRSVKAHWTIQLKGEEPGRLDLGLFRLEDSAKAKSLYFGLEEFAGVHLGYGKPVYRMVKLREYGLFIYDYICEPNSRKLIKLNHVNNLNTCFLSISYGVHHE
ncbi:MAG: alginate lyase family protein [Xenococcaceae cyanobacterium]